MFDYGIPALITKLENIGIPLSRKTVSISRTLPNSTEIQLHTVRRLRRFLDRIPIPTGTSRWTNYGSSCSYTRENYSQKKEFIENFLLCEDIDKVLDLGCNTGDLSLLAADHGADVVAVDSDAGCVDRLYHRSKERQSPILSLRVDIANPSPSIGWFNKERSSFLQRVNRHFDCVFALALIHHLLVTNRIPLPEIASLLRHCTSRFLVVEYIGPSDKLFRELLRYRTESYNDISRDTFEATMLQYFSIKKKTDLAAPEGSMDRCLYLMECK